LIAYAKANPGKLSIATPPKGTGPAMAAELFKITAGLDVVVVRYRADAQVVTDVLGEQLQVAFGGISPVSCSWRKVACNRRSRRIAFGRAS
jgi:tripartite-type tricarboxylate transporter receptor subunit TctC